VALGVKKVRAGVWNAVLSGFRLHRFVEDPERTDDVRIRVGQQGEGDLFAIREILQHGHRIVADGGQPQAAFPNQAIVAFQLHELGFAVGSPIRRAVEDQQGALGSHDGFEGLSLAGLIRRRELVTVFPISGPDGTALQAAIANRGKASIRLGRIR